MALNETPQQDQDDLQRSVSGAPASGRAVVDFFSTDEIFLRVAASADEEFSRSVRLLFWSGVAAGLSIGLSFLARAAATASVPQDESGLIGNLLYPVGFILIVLGRYQLFTENTLTPVSLVLTRLASIPALLRNWGIVLFANLVGATVIAFVLARTGIMDGETLNVAIGFGEHALETAWSALFFKGIIAGWLVASMVWIIHAARDSVSRFLVVFFLMYLIPSLGLYHCIIGACEALFLVFRGQAGLGEALGGFFLPVLLGNTIGGVLLVGILNYAQTRDNRFPDRDCGQLELTWREWLFEIHTGTPGEEPLTPRGEPKGTEDRLNNPANAADHSLGPDDADLTLVQYGDYECPTSQRIYETVMDVTADLTVRYVYRHLPLSQRHQHAHMAARAAEAAAAQGQFWKMHDLLFTYQNHLEEADLRGYAEQLGLDMAQFERDMNADAAHQRITDDRESAIDNGVRTTANLFINGARHQGEYTREALREVITRRHDRFQRLAPEAL